MLVKVRTHGDYTLWKNTRGSHPWSIDKSGTNTIHQFRTQREALDAWNKLTEPQPNEAVQDASWNPTHRKETHEDPQNVWRLG